MPSQERPRPAMVEDADSDDNVIDGSYKYAHSTRRPLVAIAPNSSMKHESNMGKKKTPQRRRDSTSPETDSDPSGNEGARLRSKSKPREPEKMKEPLAKKSSLRRKKSVSLTDAQKRPNVRGTQTAPPITLPTFHNPYSDDEFNGVPADHSLNAARSRPQFPRPTSYYGPATHAAPPASRPTYEGQYPSYSPQQGPPFQYSPGPYGPFGHHGPPGLQPPYMRHMEQTGNAGYQYPMPPPPPRNQQPMDYYRGRSLPDRLTAPRPGTSMGFRDSRSRYVDHGSRQIEEIKKRHPPVTNPKKQKEKVERPRGHTFALPVRPSSTRPDRNVYMPPARPAVPAKRFDAGFDLASDSEDSDSDNYRPTQTRSRRQSRVEYGVDPILPQIKYIRPTSRASEDPPVGSAPRQRRNSTHELQAKMKKAFEYQVDVSGSTAPLDTVASLHPPSSRSSRSSGWSSHRKSATTHTTRSGSEGKFTIIGPDGSVVEVDGQITRDGQGGVSLRGSDYDENGGDRKMLLERDDRSHSDHKSRAISRPPSRLRGNSSAPYPRAMIGQGYFPAAPRYLGSDEHASSYTHGRHIPPPPQYPHVVSDDEGGVVLH